MHLIELLVDERSEIGVSFRLSSVFLCMRWISFFCKPVHVCFEEIPIFLSSSIASPKSYPGIYLTVTVSIAIDFERDIDVALYEIHASMSFFVSEFCAFVESEIRRSRTWRE